MTAAKLAMALDKADWSNTSIGNKCLIKSAIIALRNSAENSAEGVGEHATICDIFAVDEGCEFECCPRRTDAPPKPAPDALRDEFQKRADKMMNVARFH